MEAGEVETDVDLGPVPGPVDLHDADARLEVEQALRGVPGVLAARIVPGYEREVDELHVLTSLEKAPKAAVRDVQSLLMARFGVTTDHRVISVVQLDEDDTVVGATAMRVAIESVSVVQEGLTCRVEVTVRRGDSRWAGTSEGPASGTGRRRAAARAALEAIRPLLASEQVVEIEGADVAEVVGRSVAVTLVHVHTARGERAVSGSALVRGDEADAIARSVLDAMNRSVVEAAQSRTGQA